MTSCQPENNSSQEDAPTSTKLQLPDLPNILWLVTEDMGPYIPPFGDSTIQTPNLSRLAAEGVIYPNLFSPSGVCAPSRAAIVTGMYPSSIGANHMRTNSYSEITGLPTYEAVPPSEVRMISELLRMRGYYCTNNSKTDYQFNAQNNLTPAEVYYGKGDRKLEQRRKIKQRTLTKRKKQNQKIYIN